MKEIVFRPQRPSLGFEIVRYRGAVAAKLIRELTAREGKDRRKNAVEKVA